MKLEDTLVLETSAFGHESSTLSSATNIHARVAELVDAAGSKPVSTCRFDPCRAHHAPVADGEANGLQSRNWRFESVPECHALQANGERAGRNPVERGSIPRQCSNGGR